MAETRDNLEHLKRKPAARLGDLLVRDGLVTPEQLEEALKVQKKTGGRLGKVVIQLGYASEIDVTAALAELHKVPFIDLSLFDVDEDLVRIMRNLKGDEMQGLADYLSRMQGPVRDRARMKNDGTVSD